MPEMGKLLAQGDLASMDTVYPPLSSVSWTTFFTGVNPGRHRIFGFFEAQVDDYGIWFQNLRDVKMPGLWDYAQAHGLRTVSINLPGTYPAPPFNGVMISGFIAQEMAKSVYPKVLLPLLEKIGYVLDVVCEKPWEQPEFFWQQTHKALTARGHVISALLQHEPFDLFIGVLTETDRVQHFFFDALEDAYHPQREACYCFYRAVDSLVGEWVSHCRAEDKIIILADHGFCRIEQEIYINHWLKENAFLVMKKESKGVPLAEIDPGKTKAFALDPGRIFLNLKGRQANGCVEVRDATKVLDEIATGVKQMSIKAPWSPNPFQPIEQAFRREEIYRGPWTQLAADLILHSADGYDMKGKFNHPVNSDIGNFTGMHTFGDAMLYIRGAKWKKQRPEMLDVAPTLLHLLGLPVPEVFEGVPLVE